MTNTSKWPIKTFGILELTLDPTNVRLRAVEPREADILRYMYEYEDAFKLASDIAQDGLFDHDLPIVVQEGKKWVVLEGNRRLSALKGIANPVIVPHYKTRLAKLRQPLSKVTLSELESIRVMVAPDRASAQPILASLHTRNPKKSWPLDQQAAFYKSQLVDGVTVDELKKRYPTVATKIPGFIRMAEMYDLVRKSDLGEETLAEFVRSKKFKMSVYERLYSSVEFQSLIGVKFKDNGQVQVKGKKDVRNRVLSQVVRDMNTAYLDTRRLGRQDSREFKEYLLSLGLSSVVPKATPLGTTAFVAAGQPLPLSKLKRKDTVNTSSLTYGLNSPGLERRFLELKKINVILFPNAAMDLIRTVLECSIKQYFKESSNPIPAGNSGYVMLKDALEHSHKVLGGNKALNPIITSLKTKAPQDEVAYSKSSLALNSINHNPDVFFGPNEVRDTWDHVLPLVEFLLAGPVKNLKVVS